MIVCPSCNRKYQSSVIPLHCLCGWHGSPAVIESQPAGDGAWSIIHQRLGDALLSGSWDSEQEQRWYASEWLPTIPRYGCSCEQHWAELTSEHPINWSSAKCAFESLWWLHNEVSKRFANHPAISLDEAYSLYAPPTNPPFSMPVVTALSLKANHIERQSACLNSWKRFGFTVIVKNTSAEIERLAPRYPQVDQWIESNTLATDYAYPTQLIRNLAITAAELGKPVLLLNSDIEVYGFHRQLQCPDGSQLAIVRWNYKQGRHRSTATEFQWGIDGFSFTPEQALLLPESLPVAIGHAMWDYVVPFIARHNGIPMKFVHDRMFFHLEHEQNWVQDSWNFGAAWLKSFYGFDIRTWKGSANYRQSLDPEMFYEENHNMYLPKNWQQSPR